MVSGSVPVDEFTTPDPITANEDMTIDDLRNLMEKHGIRHLPVVRGDRVVGVISDRNVRIVSSLPIAEKDQVRAADIMAADPLTVIACVFQTKPATDSTRRLPPIPRESCH